MYLRIVAPDYNEEESLGKFLSRIDLAFRHFQWQGDVVIVNDGSQDTTLEIAHSFKGIMPVHTVNLQPNRGLAGAIGAGFVRGLEGLKDSDVIVTLDADNTHNPFLIQNMLVKITDGSDIVIASRYQPGAKVFGLSGLRCMASDGASLLFQMVAALKGVKDYTCGFRAYRVEVLRKTMAHYQERFILQKGFGCMAEILLKAAKFSRAISEVPMVLRYNLKRGQSKMKVAKTIAQTLRMLWDYKSGKGF